jgi:hypothetical protein
MPRAPRVIHYTESSMTYMTEQRAIETAAFNNAGDDWTYTIEQRGEYYVIAVRDEDGILMGYL